MSSRELYAAIDPLVAALEKLGITYYVGGSLASSTHGIPRSTMDVDIVANLDYCHVEPLVDALKLSYYIDGRIIREAIARRSCFNLIHLATSFKMDVFVLKNRSYDREAFSRIGPKTTPASLPSASYIFASPEDVVLAKLEWFRLGNEVSQRQWSDVLGVMKVQGNHLDRAYLQKWAAELGVADLLEKALQETKDYFS